MKSLSIDSIHAHLDKKILLAESYSNCKGLSFIIKACRLMPVEYPTTKDTNIILYRHWIDEFGNSLKISKKKKIEIVYNDLTLDKSNCTDMYYGLSMENIYNISKFAFISSGIDEDTLKEKHYVSLLGIDNYFRTYFFDDEWGQLSTLHLGIDNLKLIASKIDIKYFLEFNNLKKMPYPCIRANQWLTVLPVSKACIDSMTEKYSGLTLFSNQKDLI